MKAGTRLGPYEIVAPRVESRDRQRAPAELMEIGVFQGLVRAGILAAVGDIDVSAVWCADERDPPTGSAPCGGLGGILPASGRNHNPSAHG